MSVIHTARGPIHYRDYRKDDGALAPYILIHGAGSQYIDFPVQMRRQLPAIALDLPGHGQSPRSQAMTIEGYAQDVHALAEALAIEKAVFVGHSMGGAIALQIALDFPEAVYGMVLIATGAKLIVNSQIIDGIIAKPRETAQMVTKWSWGKSIDDALLEQAAEHLLETPLDVIQADYIACDNFDVRDRLSEIEAPTLIIAGTQDKMTPLQWNQQLAEGIPNSILNVIDDRGHMVHAQDPDRVVSFITSWRETI